LTAPRTDNPDRGPGGTERRSQVSRERLPFLIAAVILTAGVAVLGIDWLTVPVAMVALLVFWFFRDPERHGPENDRLVLSPADGTVVAIREMPEDRFLKENALRVSIFLSIFNVHVNRIPVGGRILAVAYQPGRFFMAHKDDASTDNEQNAVLLETERGEKILFVQIAGLIARRILCWVREGDSVKQGSRFGMIRFGSRTDIYLPLSAKVGVKPGDRVKGGLTVIGELT
jgi:phosphatidylserine decarboxylase